MTKIELNQEQAAAVSLLTSRLADGRESVMSGPAGSGKTTVLKHIHEKYPRAAVVTPTGRAAKVLQNKGVDVAQTLHGFLYWPLSVDPLKKQTNLGLVELSQVAFEAKEQEEIEIGDVVIVDEASMVGPRELERLRGTGRTLLLIGDPYQLKPVAQEATGVLDRPNVHLNFVMRHTNQILDLANNIRLGKRLSELTYPKMLFHDAISPSVIIRGFVEKQFDVLITHSNRDRFMFNNAIRDKLGHRELLNVGDKVVCLQNNNRFKIVNGETFVVEIVIRNQREMDYVNFVYDYDGWSSDVIPSLGYVEGINDKGGFAPFGKKGTVSAVIRSVDTDKQVAVVMSINQLKLADAGILNDQPAMPFAYGYAMTCHKCQGSEFKKVMVYARSKFAKETPGWLYTAATRAQETLALMI